MCLEKGSAGFDKTGTLVVATNEEVEATIKTGIALAKAAGYTGEYITDKDRIKEILPDISTDNILGAGYTADDGYFDGTMISNTYAKKMQKNGGVIKTGVKVTEVVVEDNKVKGLKTSEGEEYEFDYVVDCTGPWSKFTGELVGLDVPIWHTKAEAFFLCPPGKKLDYTFPVLKYPEFYGLRAGDNIFICKSHLSTHPDPSPLLEQPKAEPSFPEPQAGNASWAEPAVPSRSPFGNRGRGRRRGRPRGSASRHRRLFLTNS